MEIVELDAARVRVHADELAQLLLDAHASNMALGLSPGLTHERAVAEWATLVERLDVLLAAVDDGGVVVGAGGLMRGRGNGRHRGEIQRLVVRGDRRGSGIGTALLAALVARAEALGLSLLWLTTHADTPSATFYERLGWRRYAVVDGWAQRPDGEFVPNVFLSLALPGRTTA
jgi:GNAT superfamily N-acetyltransferase